MSFFTKFTNLKSQFSQNLHFWNLNFHKIQISEILFFAKFTFLKYQNLGISGYKVGFCPSVRWHASLSEVFHLNFAIFEPLLLHRIVDFCDTFIFTNFSYSFRSSEIDYTSAIWRTFLKNLLTSNMFTNFLLRTLWFDGKFWHFSK